MGTLIQSICSIAKGLMLAVAIWLLLFALAYFTMPEVYAQTPSSESHLSEDAQGFNPYRFLDSLEENRQAIMESQRQRSIDDIAVIWPRTPQALQMFITEIANKRNPTVHELEAAGIIGNLSESMQDAMDLIEMYKDEIARLRRKAGE